QERGRMEIQLHTGCVCKRRRLQPRVRYFGGVTSKRSLQTPQKAREPTLYPGEHSLVHPCPASAHALYQVVHHGRLSSWELDGELRERPCTHLEVATPARSARETSEPSEQTGPYGILKERPVRAQHTSQ